MKAIFCVAAIPNKDETTSTFQEYVGLFKKIASSSKYGMKPFDAPIIACENEGKLGLIHGTMEFPSKQHVLDLFADEEYVTNAIPLRKTAFIRLKASVVEIDEESSTAVFAVGAIKNVNTETSTLMEYLKGWKEISGSSQYDKVESIVDERMKKSSNSDDNGDVDDTLIHGFMTFDSVDAMRQMFDSKEYKDHAAKYRTNAFAELKGLDLSS